VGVGAGGYEAMTLDWAEGDRVLLYTDGLSEARNHSGEFLPLSAVIPGLREGPPDRALDTILAHVAAYVPHGRLEDDLAMVLLENLAPADAA
jgi:phosphoserine phosphatase RsbU/P